MMLAALLLAGYPLLHQQVPVLEQHVKSYAVFPQLFLQSAPDSQYVPNPARTTLPDSIEQDSNQFALAKISADKTEVQSITSDYQGVRQLHPFFQKLHRRKGQLRIAYYGDSSVEGDLICMTFRDSLQRQFGGRGVGFVPIMSIQPGFRRSIHQAASNNWTRNTVGAKNKQALLRGISGEYFTARYAPKLPDTIRKDSLPPPTNAHYWATFKGSKWFSRTSYFEQGRLFYGRPKLDSNAIALASLSVKADQQLRHFTLRPNAQINSLTILDTAAQRLRLDFQVPGNFPLYGLSLESKKGIIVDNFPLRGSDGGSLRSIPVSVLNAFQQELDYDLIIFHFGLNVLNPQLKDYSWYQSKIEKLIEHYQVAMPGVPILILGISDKSTKIGGKMQTDPSIPYITAAQRAAAQNKQVSFFSLYEAMGGAGAMVDWVEYKSPKLANSDYTHFTFKGARKMSNYLLTFLNQHYMDYVVYHTEEL